MTNLLLIILIASVWVNIWIALRIAKSIDKPDFSQEDAQVKESAQDVIRATRNLPPLNK